MPRYRRPQNEALNNPVKTGVILDGETYTKLIDLANHERISYTTLAERVLRNYANARWRPHESRS